MGKDPLGPIIIRYSGLYDFDAVYAAIIDWAKNYGYMWHEQTYKHKHPVPTGAEQQFVWILEKRLTEWIKYHIRFKVHTWDQQEIMVDTGKGKKKPMTTGRIHMRMSGSVEYDWQGKFEGSKFAEKLGHWYKLVRKKYYESTIADGLWYKMWNLHAVIKKEFDMQTKKYAYQNYLGDE